MKKAAVAVGHRIMVAYQTWCGAGSAKVYVALKSGTTSARIRELGLTLSDAQQGYVFPNH